MGDTLTTGLGLDVMVTVAGLLVNVTMVAADVACPATTATGMTCVTTAACEY